MRHRRSYSGLFGLLPLLLAFASPAGAQTDPSAGADEDALSRRVTERVMEELKNGDFLQQQIQLGIERFIREQREAQANAKADQQIAAVQRAESVRRVSVPRDHVYGNPDARISLIEYSDFECPFCKRFHGTAKQVVESYGGEVNWVYRHFPLAFHNPLAQKEAEASECAGELGGNDGFWRYADAVYEKTRSNGKGFPIDGLAPLAGDLGFDVAEFQACLDSGRFASRVAEDFTEGQSIGISGTPGNILLDNKTGTVRIVSGAVPLPRMRSAIDALLASP